MIILKGDKGKSGIVQCLKENMQDTLVLQYCKQDELIYCSNIIIPTNASIKDIIYFIIENISREYNTIIIYTDRTEQEIQELQKELDKNCSYLFNFIITCTL